MLRKYSLAWGSTVTWCISSRDRWKNCPVTNWFHCHCPDPHSHPLQNQLNCHLSNHSISSCIRRFHRQPSQNCQKYQKQMKYKNRDFHKLLMYYECLLLRWDNLTQAACSTSFAVFLYNFLMAPSDCYANLVNFYFSAIDSWHFIYMIFMYYLST